MIQGDRRIIFSHVDHGAPPQAGRGQDVGLIDGGHLAPPALGGLHGKGTDARNFRDAVIFKVPGPFDAVVNFRFTAIAEIDAADEFADDEDIGSGNDVGL